MNNISSHIIRRNVQIPYSNTEKYSFYYEDNPVVTSLFVLLSGMFPPGEMFFIETIRNVRDQINDPKLQEDIKQFIAQEAFHNREHKALNQHLVHQIIPKFLKSRKKPNKN